MHLSPEMPSFLNDENSPIYSPNSGIVHLDPTNEFAFSHDRVDGKLASQSHQPRHIPSNDDSFDDSSAHSTHTSDISEPRTQLNGDASRPTSMSTLPNGQPGWSVAETAASSRAKDGSRPLHNGFTTPLVDRTATQPLPNGTRTSSSPGRSPRETNPRGPSSTVLVNSYQQLPPPMQNYASAINGDSLLVDGDPSRNSNLTAKSAPVAVPRTPDTTTQRSQYSPHRLSSPPVYQQGGAAPPATAPGNLQPPINLQAPTNPGIKHRHTLEVPKLTPSRASRDGVDQAYSSGRFSPTTATPGGGRRGSLNLGRRNTRSVHSEVPRDEVIPDEDALRWAEAYRQKRASKRKRKDDEDDDRVLVGTKVDENHANWMTAYNMLTGIRVSVSRTNAKLDRPLTDADFETKQKSTFDIAGNELVPSAKYDFKFKDYAPWVFRHLRALFRLDPADYLMSLTGKYILSELGSPGKSGSFFYYSRDYKYIIKTIHHAEHKFLRKILKQYYNHVTENPNTLLSQFYGLHRVKIPYGKKIHFVVMNNLFPPHKDIHQTFDLKGSTIGRDYKEDDLDKNPRATLKDLNWLRRSKHLELGIQKKQLFLQQLEKDVRLLQKLDIMDYSLLIGIHDLQRGNEENLRDKTLQVFNPGGNDPSDDQDPHSVLMRTPSKLENARKAKELRQMIKSERPVPMTQTNNRMPSELEEGQNRPGFVFNNDDGGYQATHEDNAPADEIYYLGVIDCLTHYGVIKKIENFWKGTILAKRDEKSQISALPPHQYGERFINFVSGVTMSQEEATREAQERDAREAAAAAAEEQEMARGKDRTSRGSTSARQSTSTIPPMPLHQPPPPPIGSSSSLSPEARDTMEKAELQARKPSKHGTREEDTPSRTIRTTASPTSSPSGYGSPPPPPEHRESMAPILPVVDEANETASTGAISRSSKISDRRPVTPSRDTDDRYSAHMAPRGAPAANGPPTPPKTGYLKPVSADSGYGVTGVHSTPQPKLRHRISKDSLDKELPPLPSGDGGKKNRYSNERDGGSNIIRVGMT